MLTGEERGELLTREGMGGLLRVGGGRESYREECLKGINIDPYQSLFSIIKMGCTGHSRLIFLKRC